MSEPVALGEGSMPEATAERELRPGSREDFDVLYRRSYRPILATLTAMLGDRAAAEDCTQEAFVRAFKAWDRWRPDAAPEAWLHRIAVNVAQTHRRRERLGQAQELVRRLGRPREGRHPEEIADQNEVIAALSRLPPDQSAALVLRHYHGYTNREIAQAIGVPERTVASRLARAKEKLRRVAGWSESEAGAGDVADAGDEAGGEDGVLGGGSWLESSDG